MLYEGRAACRRGKKPRRRARVLSSKSRSGLRNVECVRSNSPHYSRRTSLTAAESTSAAVAMSRSLRRGLLRACEETQRRKAGRDRTVRTNSSRGRREVIGIRGRRGRLADRGTEAGGDAFPRHQEGERARQVQHDPAHGDHDLNPDLEQALADWRPGHRKCGRRAGAVPGRARKRRRSRAHAAGWPRSASSWCGRVRGHGPIP